MQEVMEIEEIVIPSNENIIKMFNCKNIVYKNLIFTKESLYSLTYHNLADKITSNIISLYNSINKHLPSNIIDATANIGGNTISFARSYKNVLAFEIKTTTYNALNNNIQVFGIHNVTTVNDDFIKHIDKVAIFDTIFIDPPWYKINNTENTELAFNSNYKYSNYETTLEEVIIRILKIKKILISVKVPLYYESRIIPIRKDIFRKFAVLYFN